MGDLVALRHADKRARAAPRKHLRLSKDMRADEAFRTILADTLTAAVRQAVILRAGRSVKALHDLRVALRRLEVMLNAFGKAFDQAWFEELRGRTKAVSASLSPARDLDVFLEDLWPEATGNDDSLAPLRRAAEESCAKAWKDAEACIASEDFRHLLDDLAALAQSRLPLCEARIGPISRALLARAAKRVKRRGRVAESGNEADLHRLRIGLKKLCYLSQVFAPLHDAQRAKPYLKALKLLQEELGHLNDIAHVHTTIAALLCQHDRAAIGYGAALFASHYDAGREGAARKALKRYRDFKAMKPFWQKPG